MSTLNGFGTMFYGWKHFAGQPSTATKWLAVFYIPIIPMGRYKLRVQTNFARDSTQVRSTVIGVVASQENRFEILEKTPFHWLGLLSTYAKTFVGLPLLMLAPAIILWFLGSRGWLPHYNSQEDMPMWVKVVLWVLVIGTLVSVLYWPIWAIRRSRGMYAGNKPRAYVRKTPVDRRSVDHHL